MNKAERLNDMILFLNNKNTFNLSDLMKRYNISKSTAIRDIQSLEEIGMPIFSNLGRNGSYGVLNNRLLSPIIFNMDEVFALYFSMITLKDYETTPFHLSLEQLKKKFEKCLSPEKIEILHKMEQVFSFGTINHHNQSALLKEILYCAVDEKVCKVKYIKKGIEKIYYIQFFDISSSFGQWYATGYNFETESVQIFRCDKVLELEEDNSYSPKPFSDFKQPANKLYRTSDSTDFEVYITTKGIDLFQKEHYPSMNLDLAQDKPVIRGFYNKGEGNFIADYFLGYGSNILSIKPAQLSELILLRLNRLKNYYLALQSDSIRK